MHSNYSCSNFFKFKCNIINWQFCCHIYVLKYFIHRQRDKDTEKDIERCCVRVKEIERAIERESHRHRYWETERESHRQTEWYIERHRDVCVSVCVCVRWRERGDTKLTRQSCSVLRICLQAINSLLRAFPLKDKLITIFLLTPGSFIQKGCFQFCNYKRCQSFFYLMASGHLFLLITSQLTQSKSKMQ